MSSAGTPVGPSRDLTTGVIDVNVTTGPDVPSERSCDLASVHALQRQFGIGLSLLRNARAVRVSRRLGNRSALDLVGERGVLTAAVASTLHPDSLRDDLAAAVAGGAKAIWVEYEGWAQRTDAARHLIQEAMTTHLPLLIPHRNGADATQIGELTADGGVPVVLVEARYPDYPELIPALQRHEHLHLETSSLGSYGAIETLVSVVGHERIVYGSGSPIGTPLSPIYAVLQANLSADQKRAIFAGNAMRILGVPSPEPTTLTVDIPDRIFDVHGHFFPAPWQVPDQPGRSLLGELDRWGIHTQVASSVPAIMGDLEFGNQQTVQACRENPRQLGYLVAHPDDIELARTHIRKWGDAPGIVGVKVHAEATEVPTTSPRMRQLFEVLDDYGKPVKIHNVGEGWQEALLAIARAHPRLPIIVAHAGYHRPQPSSAPIVNGTGNVHLEFASSKADIRDARDLLGSVDPDRILFGSDAPLINPAWVLGLYQDLGVPRRDLDRIYWDNAKRLFGDVH